MAAPTPPGGSLPAPDGVEIVSGPVASSAVRRTFRCMGDVTGIVGGGIGGLTLALALARAGLEAEVVERRPSFAETGAGIVLGPNAMAVLKALGLAEALQSRGREVGEGRITDAAGGRLMSIDYRDPGGRRPPALAIHRADLHEALREAVPFPVHLATTVASWTVTHGGVEARLSNGQLRRWALMVGSDGIRSEVRSHVAGAVPIRYAGYTCWRCVVDAPCEGAVEMWGRGRRVGVVSLAQDRSYAFFTANAPRAAPEPWKDLAGFRGFFAEFADPARWAASALGSLEDLRYDDLEDLWVDRWWRGPVVLLGDAAHAMTPNMGQGAGMAIEDAAALARALQDEGVGEAALSRYEAERKPRVREVHARSWWLGKVAQAQTRVGTSLRNTLARLTPASAGRAQVARLVEGVPEGPRLASAGLD